MDFLVQMEVVAQIDSGDELLKKEAERARQLAEAGILRRLWRVPGRRANCTPRSPRCHSFLTSVLPFIR
jgi:muconolactone D-isomerase